MRTDYDLEMMREMGFCQGIENYARHITGREPGARPYTLLDFFPKDYLLLVDESHVTIPQIGGMYEGDKSRKSVLVEHGFRLPSAMDNRPLQFSEFMDMTHQRVYVSATPSAFEQVNSRPDNKGYIAVKTRPDQIGYVDRKKLRIKPSGADDSLDSFHVNKAGFPLIVEQIIRPTGLLDPVIHLRELKGQIDETIELCRQRVVKGERALVTTLTKKTAEDLSEYLQNTGLKVRYIHADIDTVERVEILRQLRAGAFDVLVGINLLREGLDLPEVSLVCILDADKEGFLRNDTSLIQTAGRAARHVNGECYLFCDTVTDSIQALLNITESRRARQLAFNEKHGITPQSVVRPIQESLQTAAPQMSSSADDMLKVSEGETVYNKEHVIAQLEAQMREASAQLEFELAAHLRDQIKALRENAPPPQVKTVNYKRKK